MNSKNAFPMKPHHERLMNWPQFAARKKIQCIKMLSKKIYVANVQ